MTDTFRALCAELLKGLDENRHPEVRYPGHLRIVMASARAALAEPESIQDRVAQADAAIEASMERIRAIAAPARAALAQPESAELTPIPCGETTPMRTVEHDGRSYLVPEQPEPVGPTDEELLGLDELRDAWNAQADAVNSWDELGMDEIICFAQQQALARYGRPALTPIAVSERLPEAGKKVIVHYVNSLGNSRTVCAEWVPAKSRTDDCLVDDDFAEYDEENDEYYWPEGWYESIENWDEYGAVFINDAVTHWQPLPNGPAHSLHLPGQPAPEAPAP
jgi:hypothetical protein